MKHITELTLDEKVKLAAELDDVVIITIGNHAFPRTGDFKPYTTSYDAIIPLRVKICATHELKVAWLNAARAILHRKLGRNVSDFDIASIESADDLEALLVATGKAVV